MRTEVPGNRNKGARVAVTRPGATATEPNAALLRLVIEPVNADSDTQSLD